ncbi:alpha/beta-hydrolase [Hysterangium stoloniferum]|nr:alpha/beta-hydrolase [Hysterangium stoloniferum]
MSETQSAPYGTWKSPITAELLSDAAVRLSAVIVDDLTGEVYYLEARPSEGGRNVLVRAHDNKDVIDSSWNMRTRVHEYGGVPATVHGGVIYFSSIKDGRIYRMVENSPPCAVTPDNKNLRYADITALKDVPTVLLAILEDHIQPEPANVVNKLVAIDTNSQLITTIAEGADFYAFPVVSPNGRKIAWIQWHHPDMPWEGSELVVADLMVSGSSLAVQNPEVISGERLVISVDQPKWSSDDVLLFLSDKSGYSNPWMYSLTDNKASAVFPAGIPEDFAKPAWALGASDYTVLTPGSVLYASTRDGRSVLSFADLESLSLKELPISYSVITNVKTISTTEALFIGKKDDEAAAVIKINLKSDGVATFDTIKSTSSDKFPRNVISKAQSITLSSPSSNEPLHVLYYPPFNPKFSPVDGELPPCIVYLHGGPTGCSDTSLNWDVQFWTTRGWAWLDVNYGGSSGYGRKYRERLKGNWGIVDVDDTIEAIRQFGKQGLIDPKRVAARGRSSSGLTVLGALIKDDRLIGAATSSFGVSDLVNLAEFTHKFESQYLFGLIGGSIDDIRPVLIDRSPITHVEKIKTPLLILQGNEDAIVPPEQSESIANAIKKRKGLVDYVLFDGEGHGWRKAETIKRALEIELAWYELVFGLTKDKQAVL